MALFRAKFLCWCLAISVALPQLLIAQEAERDKARAEALKLIPEDATAAVIAFPSATMRAPCLEMLPTEVLSAMGRQSLGIDPANVEVAVVAAQLSPNGIPSAAVALKTTVPIDRDAIPMSLTGERQEGELNGNPYWQTRSGMSFYFADEQNVFVGFDTMIRRMISDDNGADSKLKQYFAAGQPSNVQVVVMLDPLRPMIEQAMLNSPPLPGDIDGLKDIPDDTQAVEVRFSAAERIGGSIALHAIDEEAASRIDERIVAAMETGKQIVMQGMASGRDEVNRAASQYVQRMSKLMMDKLRPSRDGATLVLGGETGSEGQVVIASTLTMLLLPAVQAAREAARRSQAGNQLKMIMLALLNHEAVYARFPTHAIYSDEGKPLLSWRVTILPYIEEVELYERFHLDEPWDSDHNKQLIPLMPQVYLSKGQKNEGKTRFLGLVGKDYFFSGEDDGGRRLRDISDGTSLTMTVLEADTEVTWTKPEDYALDVKQPTKNLGKLRGHLQAAFCDGHVAVLSIQEIKAQLKKWATIAGGEQVPRK